jgi:hypothetical protein
VTASYSLTECNNVAGHTCTTDADCGGLLYACQARTGKCDCPSKYFACLFHRNCLTACTVGKICSADYDCGGYAGTCGYKDKTTGHWNHCKVLNGFGANSETCSCQWCPTSKPQLLLTTSVTQRRAIMTKHRLIPALQPTCVATPTSVLTRRIWLRAVHYLGRVLVNVRSVQRLVWAVFSRS